jgi:HptB-dependent secretion and biofilm anti anti-sigma factor
MSIKTQIQDTTFKMIIQDRFDSSSYGEFKNICEQIFSNKSIQDISVDVSSLEYMDSAAMGMLMLLDEKAEATKKKVTLISVPGRVAEILKTANADKLFSINLPNGIKLDLRK